ncbi:hypothetical protein [Gillisia sp. Hel_I_29]|uniref:hypothetical protein n=1 Tax=Gillisia sp. Hel_I_29 TaxID=1249975 RepID=UPI000691AFBF|nr:hypothetical protein [Gillisia sp. Hel_I_29]
MKTIVKTLMIIVAVGTLVSCKSTFNASEAMDVPDNRNAVYQEIISNPNQFNEFIDLAQQDEGARKLMMQNHMQMMESGKMNAMMEKNPEMKEKMKKMMQKKMEEDPEMKEMMGKMIMKQMKENPEMKEKMMHEMMHQMGNDPELRKKMMQGMMKKMKENPQMMQEMMEKMHDDPEMMERMKQHMDKKKGDDSKKEAGKHEHNPKP